MINNTHVFFKSYLSFILLVLMLGFEFDIVLISSEHQCILLDIIRNLLNKFWTWQHFNDAKATLYYISHIFIIWNTNHLQSQGLTHYLKILKIMHWLILADIGNLEAFFLSFHTSRKKCPSLKSRCKKCGTYTYLGITKALNMYYRVDRYKDDKGEEGEIISAVILLWLLLCFNWLTDWEELEGKNNRN